MEDCNELDGNNFFSLYLPYQKEIKLIGTTETEWVKTYTDVAGRDFKTVFASADLGIGFERHYAGSRRWGRSAGN